MLRRHLLSLCLLLPWLGACESDPAGPADTAGAAVVMMSAAVLGGAPISWDATGHAYDAIEVPGGVTWVDARDAAAATSFHDCPGYLATLTSAEENAFVAGNLTQALPAGQRGFWIGGWQLPGSPEPDGGWTWITGEAFEFTNWSAYEPNDWRFDFPLLGEDAIHLSDDGAGAWNDLPSLDITPGYVIEYDPVCSAGDPSEIPIDLQLGGGHARPINLLSRGVVAVVALSTSLSDGDAVDFDAADIDPSSVTLGDEAASDTPVALRRNGSMMAVTADADGDGDSDMIFHFRTQELVANGDVSSATTVLVLLGETEAGSPFRGSDAVRIVPN